MNWMIARDCYGLNTALYIDFIALNPLPVQGGESWRSSEVQIAFWIDNNVWPRITDLERIGRLKQETTDFL